MSEGYHRTSDRLTRARKRRKQRLPSLAALQRAVAAKVKERKLEAIFNYRTPRHD